MDSPEAKDATAEFEFRQWEDPESDPEEKAEENQSLIDTAQGIEVQQTQAGVIETIFLYSHGHQGFARFSRRLTRGLQFSNNRDEVRQAMGAPSHSGEANPRALLGPAGPWDRYDLPHATIHFQFRYDRDAIALVTLMACGTAPNLDPPKDDTSTKGSTAE